MLLENGASAWDFRSSRSAQSDVKNAKECLAKGKKRLDGKNAPTQSTYTPKLDVSHELAPEEASHCQSLKDMSRWILELGSIYFCLKESKMSSCAAQPREGHLE